MLIFLKVMNVLHNLSNTTENKLSQVQQMEWELLAGLDHI